MKHPIAPPRGWRGRDIAADPGWNHQPPPEEIGGLEAALRHVRAAGKTLLEITRDDFPLGVAASMIERVADATERG